MEEEKREIEERGEKKNKDGGKRERENEEKIK